MNNKLEEYRWGWVVVVGVFIWLLVTETGPADDKSK